MTTLLTRGALEHYVSERVLDFASSIVVTEGKFVNDPDDHGGATNCGISLRWANGFGTTFDLNHDGRVNANDIRLVTPEIAVCAFVQFFYLDARLSLLPDSIQCNAFDASVNSGPGCPPLLAQQAFNRLRGKTPALQSAVLANLKEDGVLGPISVKALHTAERVAGAEALNNAFCDARLAHYEDIVDAIPRDEKFLAGWTARTERLRNLAIEYAEPEVTGPVADSPALPDPDLTLADGVAA